MFYSDNSGHRNQYGATSFINGHNNTFVLTAEGFFDTSKYSALQFLHDDGIEVSLNGNELYTYNGNTGLKDSGWKVFADTSMAEFNLLFWENAGAATILVNAQLRETGTTEIAQISTVPAPTSIALFACGLIGLITGRRRKA